MSCVLAAFLNNAETALTKCKKTSTSPKETGLCDEIVKCATKLLSLAHSHIA